MEEGRSAFIILTSKPTGKKPLRRPRRRLEDNTRMDLKESIRKYEFIICAFRNCNFRFQEKNSNLGRD